MYNINRIKFQQGGPRNRSLNRLVDKYKTQGWNRLSPAEQNWYRQNHKSVLPVDDEGNAYAGSMFTENEIDDFLAKKKYEDRNYSNIVNDIGGGMARAVGRGANNAMQVLGMPAAAVAEGVNAYNGKGFNYRNIMPDFANPNSEIYGGNQTQSTVSNALDVKNPYGAMAIDMVADPAALFGAVKSAPKLLKALAKNRTHGVPVTSRGLPSIKNNVKTRLQDFPETQTIRNNIQNADNRVEQIKKIELRKAMEAEDGKRYSDLQDEVYQLGIDKENMYDTHRGAFESGLDDFTKSLPIEEQGLYKNSYGVDKDLSLQNGIRYDNFRTGDNATNLNSITTQPVHSNYVQRTLSPEEAYIRSSYIHGYDSSFNNILRNSAKVTDNPLTNLYRKDINNLTKQITENKLPDDVDYVYRNFMDFDLNGKKFSKMEPGEVYGEKGFSSTSFSPTGYGTDDMLKIAIENPKGGKQSYLSPDATPEMSYYSNEQEALLPPGLNYEKTTRSTKDGYPIFKILNPYMKAGVIGGAGLGAYQATQNRPQQYQQGGVIPVARNQQEARMGLKDETKSAMYFPNSNNMTMRGMKTPVKYYGITNGRVTDEGVAYPGQDFKVNGKDTLEYRMNYQDGGKIKDTMEVNDIVNRYKNDGWSGLDKQEQNWYRGNYKNILPLDDSATAYGGDMFTENEIDDYLAKKKYEDRNYSNIANDFGRGASRVGGQAINGIAQTLNMPSATLAETINSARGRGFHPTNILPNFANPYSKIHGGDRTQSQVSNSLDIENPYAAFATDVLTDPSVMVSGWKHLKNLNRVKPGPYQKIKTPPNTGGNLAKSLIKSAIIESGNDRDSTQQKRYQYGGRYFTNNRLR